MSAKKARSKLLLTQRALHDVAEIERYSIEHFGRKTAAKYLRDVEAALSLLQENPGLLRAEEDLHPQLRFYRVHKHLLVCDVQPGVVFLLTVIHASRDIPSRLAEMQPSLAQEVEMLHRKLASRKKKRGLRGRGRR